MNRVPMQFPYGAVYFRKSNPPREDWERDYRKAAEDGVNIFRHWFMWGSIETAPGVYDWEDYDKQMELAAKYGIKTIIAEITTAIPEWMYKDYSHLLSVDENGVKEKSMIGVSSATGGFYTGLCLDCPEARELLKGFLQALAKRYKGHEALLGYDMWNECNYAHHSNYNEESAQAFRAWLEKKYGSLEALGKAWHRYSYTRWDQVQPPPALVLCPESFDWLEFRKINAYEQLHYKIDCIREIDSDALMTAHGTAQSLDNMALGGSDEWMSAEPVELYGFTFVQSRKGSAPYKQFIAADLTRSGARDKKFWHAEAQGGPLWLQPQLMGRPLSDGRISHGEDVRLWNIISMAAGSRGILYPRWRPLLDGALFGAFGPYAMDGGETPRSRMAATVAKWANDPAQKGLMEAVPVKGDIGIVVVPESQTASKLLSAFGSSDDYMKIMHGAYKGFFDNQIQADFVHIDDIGGYKNLYLPYPVMLTCAQAEALKGWVKAGGRLVSEGCPGYFGEGGTVRTVQPGGVLAEMFGVSEEDVMFIPDIMEDFRADIMGFSVPGCEYIQTYTLSSAECAGMSANSCIAAKNSFGKGMTLLVGTSPSLAYINTGDPAAKRYFKEAADFCGIEPEITMTNPGLIARLCAGADGRYIWLINPTEKALSGEVRLKTPLSGLKIHWAGGTAEKKNAETLNVSIEAKNALIIGI